jgi:flagellar biosynthesis protein FlhF
MRLKTFQTASMADAMAQIRAEFGAEAIIVCAETDRTGVRVVAATDAQAAPSPDRVPEDVADRLYELLDFHCVPAPLAERLIGTALLAATDDPVLALGAAFESVFAFRPLHHSGRETKPILLIGTPGQGKTATAARLAARIVLAGQPVRMLAADGPRAGAIAQITELCRPMGLAVETASDAEALAHAVVQSSPGLVVIDGPGLNPLDADDMALASELARAADAEPVLVLAAGGEAAETADIAAAFVSLGASRFVATRLDVARRLGGVLSVAASGLAFADGSIGRTLAETLVPMSPLSLARLMTNEPTPRTRLPHEEAA